MPMHRASSLLSIALLWQSMDFSERAVAIALCVVVLALIAALITVLVKSGKRNSAIRPPETEARPQRQSPPLPPQPAPTPIIPAPAPIPAENAYEKTDLIHEPPAVADEYEKTVAVDFRPAIETTFQISGAAGVLERVLPVSEAFIIGRKAGSNLQLNDSSVSQRHAKLSAANGLLQVQDMGSTNGIYLGGHKIEGVQPLRSGDTLRIGAIDIRVLYTPTS